MLIHQEKQAELENAQQRYIRKLEIMKGVNPNTNSSIMERSIVLQQSPNDSVIGGNYGNPNIQNNASDNLIPSLYGSEEQNLYAANQHYQQQQQPLNISNAEQIKNHSGFVTSAGNNGTGSSGIFVNRTPKSHSLMNGNQHFFDAIPTTFSANVNNGSRAGNNSQYLSPSPINKRRVTEEDSGNPDVAYLKRVIKFNESANEFDNYNKYENNYGSGV